MAISGIIAALRLLYHAPQGGQKAKYAQFGTKYEFITKKQFLYALKFAIL